jgi:transposase
MNNMDLSDIALKKRLEADLKNCRQSLNGIPPFSSMYNKWMVCAEIASLESMLKDGKEHNIELPKWVKKRFDKLQGSNDWLS